MIAFITIVVLLIIVNIVIYHYKLYISPNSAEGLRIRAKRLIEKEGYNPSHPYISALIKQVLLKEGRGDEVTSMPLTTTQIVNVLEEKK